MNAGNVLLGSDGLMIMDLAEVEPSPRLYKDLRGLWDYWRDEETAVLATTTYQEEAQLSSDEVELLPIVNAPIDSWRRFMDGYLSITLPGVGDDAHDGRSRKLKVASDGVWVGEPLP